MITVQHPSDSSKDLVTRNTYDLAGNLVTTVVDDEGTGQLEITTEYAYDDLGQQIAVKDPMGTTTRTWHDDAGNVTKVVANCTTSGTTNLTTTFATCTGAGTSGSGTYNMTTTYTYDDLGQQVSETAPNGRVTTTEYDEAGRVVKVTDHDVASPSGNQDLITETAYDLVGRVIGTRSPAVDRTTFRVSATEYDALGRATRTIESCTESGTTVPSTPECDGTGTANAETNIDTTMTYDAAGNLLSVTSPDPPRAPAAPPRSSPAMPTTAPADCAGCSRWPRSTSRRSAIPAPARCRGPRPPTSRPATPMTRAATS